MNHQLKREYGGEGMSGFIRPTCSCGWRGVEEYAFEDYQHTTVAERENNHIRDVLKEEQAKK